jgi:hypothetical protein
MGIGWFVGAIFLLAFATYMMAYYIHDVLQFFKYPPPPRDPILEPEKEKPNKVKTQDLGNQAAVVEEDDPKPPPLNIWREVSKVHEYFTEENPNPEEVASAQAGRGPQGLQTPPPLPPPSEKAADSQEVSEISPGILRSLTKRVRFGRAQGSVSSV